MTDILYFIIIYPLQAVIETVFLLFFRIFRNYGLAVAGVSLAVNMLALPLYHIAETWQQKERDIQKKMKPKLDKIRAVFKGDERYMITQTYYRQNQYHPVYALRSSIGLLIQVPFFIAAYVFLSNLSALNGQSFLWIKNLGESDALFKLGTLRINCLPLLMTLINIVAGAVYTKGFLLKDKLQIYGMALLFLVLLYNSPSGLVLYWTLNNIFSLVKNCFYKLKKPLAVLYFLGVTLVLAAIVYVNFFFDTTIRKRQLVTIAGVLFIPVPFYLAAIKLLLKKVLYPLVGDGCSRFLLTLASCLVLTVLCGLAIPSSVIASSPQEFSFISPFSSPLDFLAFPLAQSAGFFLFWTLCIYFLFSKKIQTLLAFGLSALAGCALVCNFLFAGSYGALSNTLVFSDAGLLKPNVSFALINLAVCAAVIIAAILLIRFGKAKQFSLAGFTACVALLVLGGVNMVSTQKIFSQFAQIQDARPSAQKIEPVFDLSPTEKNVVIFMLDRAVNSMVPIAFAENPVLQKQYEGFTYYPNTVSFNGHTIMGAPPVFGGYEYTPEKINERPDKPLVEKHNEALAMLPRLFAENGFASTITDASWANYSWTPDNRIFSHYKGIRAFNLAGAYTDLWLKEHNIEKNKNIAATIKRNLLYYSLFRVSAPILRFGLYDGGIWWNSEYTADTFEKFVKYYAIVDYLPRLTEFSEQKNTFSFITLDVTHEDAWFEYPDYTLKKNVVNKGNNKFESDQVFRLYHVNTAALLRLGAWFDYLRQNGAYDNTRIIMVSDHGFGERFPVFHDFADLGFEYGLYNPLLMVKDFNARGSLQTDMTFMTNADVPYLAAMGGIVAEAKNPFSGNVFSAEQKKDGVTIYNSHLNTPEHHNKNTFIIRESDKITVKDNIFEEKNWSVLP